MCWTSAADLSPAPRLKLEILIPILTQTRKNQFRRPFSFLNLSARRYKLTVGQPGLCLRSSEKTWNLTVGQVITIPVTMKISSVSQQIVVSDVPSSKPPKTENSATLDETAVARTPVLGRSLKICSLDSRVSIAGPDGDEININGQRGIFNNISLDGGDYKQRFFFGNRWGASAPRLTSLSKP